MAYTRHFCVFVLLCEKCLQHRRERAVRCYPLRRCGDAIEHMVLKCKDILFRLPFVRLISHLVLFHVNRAWLKVAWCAREIRNPRSVHLSPEELIVSLNNEAEILNINKLPPDNAARNVKYISIERGKDKWVAKKFYTFKYFNFFRKCRKICLTHFRARCVTMGGFPQTKTQKKLHIRRRIALLPFLSKCGVYNVEIINQSRTEFGLWHFNMAYTRHFCVFVLLSEKYLGHRRERVDVIPSEDVVTPSSIWFWNAKIYSSGCLLCV